MLRRRHAFLGAVGVVLFIVAACGGDTESPDGTLPGAEAGSEGSTSGGMDARSATDARSDSRSDAPVGDAVATDAPVDAPGDGALPADLPNILLVIGDDMGLDASVCHAVGADPGRAPRIKALCDSGIVFDNAWTAPVCSPTRAGIITGRHSFRTTVGTVDLPLPLSERGLPTALVAGQPAYAVAAFGKWHLSNATNGGPNHPNTVGFSHYAGSLPAQVPNYFNWSRTVDGVTATSTTYATTQNVNDARDWITAQNKPWFVYLAFNAPHAPFHIPPAALDTYAGLTLPLPTPPLDAYHAALEAMDTELGRLLDGLTPTARAKTWTIFVGDNGTPPEVFQAPYTDAKGSLYQGGINVPMAIAGPSVVAGGRHVTALVHSLDIFKTVLELAGANMATALPPGSKTVDSVSLVPYIMNENQAPLRPWVMSEVFGGAPFAGGKLGKTIRDDQYKLIRFADGTVELYDLLNDPYEGSELIAAGLSPDAQTHYDDLGAALDALLASP